MQMTFEIKAENNNIIKISIDTLDGNIQVNQNGDVSLIGCKPKVYAYLREPDSIDTSTMDPGQYLRHHRMCKGWKQREVAAVLNTHPCYISTFECNYRAVPKYYFEKLVEIFPKLDTSRLISYYQYMKLHKSNNVQNGNHNRPA